MEFEFSIHALERMQFRGISEDDVQEVLKNFDSAINQDTDVMIFSKILIESNKPWLYRVFVNTAKRPFLVITVYRTSKIEKYGYQIQ